MRTCGCHVVVRAVQLAMVCSSALHNLDRRKPKVVSHVAPILQDPPQPGQNSTGGRSELLASARALLDKKASAAGNTGAFFPLLLNSSGVMPMIIASAAFYGILPKAAEFVGLIGVANFIYGLQATAWGLLVYGLLVFAMEFLPFGAVNPPEVAEYFTMVSWHVRRRPTG